MRLSGVWNEPSARVRSGPFFNSTVFGPSQVASPRRPDLDQLVGDRLAVLVDDPAGEMARRLELDRDHAGLGAAAGPLDQQDVLGADRVGRDPHGHQLISRPPGK